MNAKIFSELLASATEALEHSRGLRDLRTTVLSAAPEPMNDQLSRTQRQNETRAGESDVD